MSNKDFFIVLILTTAFTACLRILPIFISIPKNNKKVNKFFEYMPIAVLTCLAIPDVFTSIGNKTQDILSATIASIFVVFLAYKKKHLGISIFSSLIFLLIIQYVIKEVLSFGIL